ncbi:MAG TPA: HAD family hydrolase, partial [Thiotrichales bacterium]|nr:HAD family hydrolase [Thiotrichales bacterium]
QANLAVKSGLFDEMETLLRELEQRKIKWGVVTNKPGWLTLPLMQALGLDERAACIVSADSTKNRKPHPEPMLYACKLVTSSPADCLYIGDARRDIEAGQNAGMRTMAALYGYIGDWENIADWRADMSVNRPAEVLPTLSRADWL